MPTGGKVWDQLADHILQLCLCKDTTSSKKKGFPNMRVRCKSGIEGWQCSLRKNYDSFSQFKYYSEMYGLHLRLGYKSAKNAWRANPLIQGSVIPSDFRKVKAK